MFIEQEGADSSVCSLPLSLLPSLRPSLSVWTKGRWAYSERKTPKR